MKLVGQVGTSTEKEGTRRINMYGVRRVLGIRSVRMKIEKRELEKLGQVLNAKHQADQESGPRHLDKRRHTD